MLEASLGGPLNIGVVARAPYPLGEARLCAEAAGRARSPAFLKAEDVPVGVAKSKKPPAPMAEPPTSDNRGVMADAEV